MYQLKYEDKLIAEFEEEPTNEEILKLFLSIIDEHLKRCGTMVGLKNGKQREAIIDGEEAEFLRYLLNEVETITNKILKL